MQQTTQVLDKINDLSQLQFELLRDTITDSKKDGQAKIITIWILITLLVKQRIF